MKSANAKIKRTKREMYRCQSVKPKQAFDGLPRLGVLLEKITIALALLTVG